MIIDDTLNNSGHDESRPISNGMRILAIETSCDETSMALIDTAGEHNNKIIIHSHLIASQASMHAEYGGVFPAIAKREHIKTAIPLIKSLFQESKNTIKEDWFLAEDVTNKEEKIKEIFGRDQDLAEEFIKFAHKHHFTKIDAVAVTNGPGLEMALWIGVNFARALGYLLNVPVIGVNHMMGHLVSPLISHAELGTEIEFKPIPEDAISLLVSGGHTELIHIQNGTFTLLGETVDDSIGEAFDKVARLMNLRYPGGPRISELAEEARTQDIKPVDLPRPMMHSNDYNFSYSGLKTAVMYYAKKFPVVAHVEKMAMALGFENAAIEVVVKKTLKALKDTNSNILILGGGVTANNHLQKELEKVCSENNIAISYPISSITGDNALMIALAAIVKINKTGLTDESDGLKATGTLQLA